MNLRFAALAFPLALAMACDKQPASPDASTPSNVPQMRRITRGTGLALESITGLHLPVLGDLEVVIDQAVITNFALVENTVGQIVGLQAEGVLQLSGSALGTDIITQNFNTTVAVTSSANGQCDIVTLDLGPISVDRLPLVQIDVPAATLTGRGSGALGSLLCNLGQVLSPVTNAVRGIVQALNNLI